MPLPDGFQLQTRGGGNAQHQLDFRERDARRVKGQHALHHLRVTEGIDIVQYQPPHLLSRIELHRWPVCVGIRGIEHVMLANRVVDDFGSAVQVALVDLDVQPVVDLVNPFNCGRQAIQRTGLHLRIGLQTGAPQFSFAISKRDFSRFP